MRRVPTTEAKARFAEILRSVENGEPIEVSRNGRVVACIVPAPDAERNARREAVDRLRARMANWKPSGMTVEEILAARHEGHRY